MLTAALASHDAVMQKVVAEVIGSYFDVQNALAVFAARTAGGNGVGEGEVGCEAGMPTLDLSGVFSRNGYPIPGLQSLRLTQASIGLTLTIPFFEGFSRTYRICGVQAQAEQAHAQLLDTQQQILREVLKAHADAKTAIGNLDASARSLDAAKTALASARNRYAFGVGDILELLPTPPPPACSAPSASAGSTARSARRAAASGSRTAGRSSSTPRSAGSRRSPSRSA